MGKPRNNKTYAYNRQTSKYQNNMYRGQMKAAGIKAPKGRNNKLIKKWVIICASIWGVASLVTFVYSRKLMFAMLLIALAGAAGLFIYFTCTDQKLIKAYMDMGISKENLIDALEKKKTDPKQIKKAGRIWDRIEKHRK